MDDKVPTSGEVLAALLERVHLLNRVASANTPGHSLSFYRVIGLLQDDGAQRIGDLAARAHMSQPGMTKTVNLLQEQGFVERTVDPGDSRATLVSVTRSGREALAQRSAQIVDHLLPVFAPLSEAERRTLQDAVDVLSKHMSGTLAAPSKEH